MDDLTSKINEIMSDPEKLKEIQNLGKMMGLNTDEDSNSNNTNNQNVLPMNSPNKSQNNNSLGPLGDFGGIDPSIIGKLAPIFSSINKEDDTTRLFDAMIPFLSEERREKLQKIRKMMVIMKLLPNIKNLGLF